MKKQVGIIGYRGMVGSVLMNRMLEEGDFSLIEPHFFSASKAGEEASIKGLGNFTLKDARDLKSLSQMDILITCQGGEYSKEIHPLIRKSGWKGIWIDAASPLRMDKNALIVLDPINKEDLLKGLKNGVKDYIGGNCTVTLMLLGLHGLYKENLVEWTTSMTYQAASGAGAKHMRELLLQMRHLTSSVSSLLDDPASSILDIDSGMRKSLSTIPYENFGAPLASSLIPWIDSPMENGQTREEWKATAEGSKILGVETKIDGLCVRVGSMRSHAQAVTMKLKKNVPLNEVEDIIKNANPWVEFVPNNKEQTLQKLTPAFTSGTLRIPVGRVRKMTLGEDFLTAFTVGDQLLWGAAEPLRRMLRMTVEL